MKPSLCNLMLMRQDVHVDSDISKDQLIVVTRCHVNMIPQIMSRCLEMYLIEERRAIA